MNKGILFALPLVLAAGVAASAWTTGYMVRSTLEDAERQALHDSGALTVVRREYHGGVFSSSETVVYGLDPNLARGNAEGAAQLSQVQFTVQHVFHHGPFPRLRGFGLATVDSQLVLPPEVLGLLTGLGPGQSPLSAHTQFAWNGDGRQHVEAPAFDISLGHGALLTWRGLGGDCDFNRALEHIRCQLSGDGLSAMDERGSGAFKQLRADFDLHRVLDQMYLGPSHLSLGAIEFKHMPAPELSLQDLRLAGDSALAGDYLEGSAAVDLGPVQAPDFSPQSAGLELKFKHVHAASFAALTKAARQQRGTVATPAALDAMLQPLKVHGTEILLHQPRLELPRLSLTTAEGTLKLSGWATLDAIERSELDVPQPMPVLAKHLQAQLDFTADEAMVAGLAGSGAAGARFSTQLADLQARGLVLRADGKLSSHLEFGGGQLKVNGQPYAPPGSVRP
jgi:uncharacterized protein YdgA (DUF945 family)